MNKAHSPILLAQCKATHTAEEVAKLCDAFLTRSSQHGTPYITVPYTLIDSMARKLNPNGSHIGAESLLDANEGSFTVTVAGQMLKEIGAEFVLVGTQQERQFLKGNGQSLKNKIDLALKTGITPFLCIGETLHEHHDEASKTVLTDQLKIMIDGLSPKQLNGLTIVHDAAWIYQGLWEADSKELQMAYQTFKDVVSEQFDPEVLSTLRLIPSIPVYSPSLAEIIIALQSPPFGFANFSFGVLDVSADKIQPLTKVSTNQIQPTTEVIADPIQPTTEVITSDQGKPPPKRKRKPKATSSEE